MEAEEALSNPPPGAHASPNFSEAAAAQLFLLRLAQGTLGELLAVIESFLDAGQAPFAWRAAHVLALVETRDERAVDALRTYVAAMHDSTAQLALADCGRAARRRMHRDRRPPQRTRPRTRAAPVSIRHGRRGARDRHARPGRRPARRLAGADHARVPTTRKSQALRRRVVASTPTTLQHKDASQGDPS